MTDSEAPKDPVVVPANETQLVTQQSQSIAVLPQPSPMEILKQAKDMGLTTDEMREMLELQKDYEKNEARKAFYVAVAEFKKNPPDVYKDKLNEKFGSGYVSIGNMVNTVNMEMSKYGLNARWEFPASENPIDIVCTCILAHSMGHTERVTLSAPPDVSGSKNPIQERKSTRTYLKLETFEAVTGMASKDGNIDDDGNAAGAPRQPQIEIISDEQSSVIHAKITENEVNPGIFNKWLSKKCPYTKGDVTKLSVDHYAMVLSKVEESIKAAKEKQE